MTKGDSTREIKSNTNDYLAILSPMIQHIREQQAMIEQMLVERWSQREEEKSYENEDDPFRPLDFSNIEGCPHELQYDVWELFAPKFDSNQDLPKFIELYEFHYQI